MITLPHLHNVFNPFQKLLHYHSSPPLPALRSPPSIKKTNLLDLEDDILLNIFEKLLNAVNVSNNKRISESAISRALPFATTCTRLMTIFSRCLTDLELWTTSNITDPGLAFICNRGSSTIKRLILRNCNKLYTSFSCITRCRALRTLDISYVSVVDDAILARICYGVGNHLQSLLIRRCVRVTDDGIRAVAEKCVKLGALDLGGLIQISDAAVHNLAKLRRDSLQILVLSWCRRLTDRSLDALADTLLQAVFLRGLHITDAGVETMVQGIREQIVALDLLDCPDVTNNVFSGCLQTCPKLRRQLVMADQRRTFHNGVALLTGYIFVVGGVNQYGQESTVVCVVDAGSANSFAFHILSGEAMTFDSDDVKVIATNSGVTLTKGTTEFLKHSFGVEL